MTTNIDVTADQRQRSADTELRRRAKAVVPNGMYGHQNMNALPAIPQYIARSRGARLWDVDGNEYVDLMCSWGPVILGHGDPVVEQAAERQRRQGDCLNGPAPVMVELAEAMVATVADADWAMFAKNGTDATTMCCTIARAAPQVCAIGFSQWIAFRPAAAAVSTISAWSAGQVQTLTISRLASASIV